MRNRLFCLVLLVLALCFLLLPSFRWALEVAFRGERVEYLEDVVPAYERMHETAIPAATLRELGQSAARDRDAHALAFVALESASKDEALQAADQAVALDPSLVWIGYYVLPLSRGQSTGDTSAATARWLERLQAADPGNGALYALRANCIQAARPDFPRARSTAGHPDPSPLAGETAWLAAMAKAYAAPQFHSYDTRRFLLEREVMTQIERATPWKMAVLWSGRRTGNVLSVRDYANYKVYYLAANAERRRQYPEALRQIRETSAFGQGLERADNSPIDQLIGWGIDLIAAEGEAEWLRLQGKTDPGVLIERKAAYQEFLGPVQAGRKALRAERSRDLARFRSLADAFVVLGGIALLLTLLGLARGRRQGRLDRALTITAALSSVLLLLTCVLLFLAFRPYAQRFQDAMTAPQPQLTDFSSDVAPLAVEQTELKMRP